MTPDTQDLIQELEQRVSGLSTALETVTESRDNWKNVATEFDTELNAIKQALKTSTAMIDRLNLALSQGVEL